MWTSIKGFLAKSEGCTLAELAVECDVLEIGALFGRSTIALASTARHVTSVDPHHGETLVNLYKNEDSLPTLRANLIAAGLMDRVTIVVARIEQVVNRFRDSQFDLIFVDGDHSAAACLRDYEIAARLVRPGGTIAIHDYGEVSAHLRDVTGVVDRFAAGRPLRIVKHLAIIENFRK